MFKHVVINDEEHDKQQQKEKHTCKVNLILKEMISLKKYLDLQSKVWAPTNIKTHISPLKHKFVNWGIEKDTIFQLGY